MGCIYSKDIQATTEIINPKNKLPLSPINIFAGFQLNIKKASKEAIVRLDNTIINSFL